MDIGPFYLISTSPYWGTLYFTPPPRKVNFWPPRKEVQRANTLPLQNLLKDQRCQHRYPTEMALKTPPLPLKNPGPSIGVGGGGADKKWNGPLDIGQVPLWKYSKTSTENHSKKRTKPTFIHLSQTSLINIVFVIRCKEHQSTMKELYFRAKGRRIWHKSENWWKAVQITVNEFETCFVLLYD